MRRADYDKHMDRLTADISDVVDGEDLYDVALASAAILSMTLKAMSEENRARTKKVLGDFMADLEHGGRQ
jgi:hypothetical protein